MNEAELYYAIGNLIGAQPDHVDTHSVMRWLGKAAALADRVDVLEAAGITSATSLLAMNGTSPTVDKVNAMLYRMLAKAELNAPVSQQGSFIAAGNPLDAMAAIGKVLRSAATSVRIVDPYMDETTLTDFIVLANEGVKIELLADAAYVKPSLAPAVQRAIKQFGSLRPIEARLASSKTLHDRLIQVDYDTVFLVSQSLNGIAARSPASVARADGETTKLKIDAYQAFWNAASPV